MQISIDSKQQLIYSGFVSEKREPETDTNGQNRTPQMTQTSSVEFRRAARRAANAYSNCPVRITEGNQAPTVEGSRSYYTTPAGNLVSYPNAYRRHFGRPIYNPSTIRVVVGAEWQPSN